MSSISKILLLVLLGFLQIDDVKAQQNLVENPSLEILSSCVIFENEIFKANGWFNPTQNTPDLFAECYSNPDFHLDTPNNFIGNQIPYDGVNFAGILCYSDFFSQPNIRDYVAVSFTDSLKTGKNYNISFHFSCADNSQFGISKIGALLHPDSLHIDTFQVFGMAPSVYIVDSLKLADKIGWQKFEAIYTALGGEKYIYIGNFWPDSLAGIYPHNDGSSWVWAYYYIDAVSVVEIPDSTDTTDTIYEISVFPNPNNGAFTLNYNLSEFENGVFKIYNAIGQIVFQEKLLQNNGVRNLQIQLASGVYVWQVESGEAVLKKEQFVIQR